MEATQEVMMTKCYLIIGIIALFLISGCSYNLQKQLDDEKDWTEHYRNLTRECLRAYGEVTHKDCLQTTTGCIYTEYRAFYFPEHSGGNDEIYGLPDRNSTIYKKNITFEANKSCNNNGSICVGVK